MENKFGRLLLYFFGDILEIVKLCKLGKSFDNLFSKEV